MSGPATTSATVSPPDTPAMVALATCGPVPPRPDPGTALSSKRRPAAGRLHRNDAMTRRWLDVVFSSRRELRPARALLSPTWLFALAVLAVNDHLLKGAGLLPGVLTGKLSDFAGMLVAPALLAALLGVTSRRGLLHCHIAVGLVFALINLSPACADAWSWLMGLVGFPWTITVDPTDLLALPALALGWRVLVPAM